MILLKRTSAAIWVKISLLNLLIVGILGLIMRLKMILPLPWINQKFLLHAHSHFAFTGWVTHVLMVLLLVLLTKQLQLPASERQNLSSKAQWLILANLLSAYGMLVTFLLQGYALYSISFSTLSIFVSYFFAVYVWKLTQRGVGHTKQSSDASPWFRGAILLLVFSSIGTFALSYLMATHNVDARKQLAAVYFYLHFQYNGWFLFACLGLFHQWLRSHQIILKRERMLFRVFAIASVPTYFLSVLWWKDMPGWLYGVVVILTMAQLVAWLFWFVEMMQKRKELRPFTSLLVRLILLIVGLALCVKLILQALSLIPDLSQLAYGYRPIVIGYLHLILLVIISLFILGYAMVHRYLVENLALRIGMYITIIGILSNEVLLMVQGLSGMLRIYINHTHQGLAVASAVICLGLLIGLVGQRKKWMTR